MAKQIAQITAKACDQFALSGNIQPKQRRKIAARAYELWLARGFRNGSPQEDWLRAQREVLDGR